MSPLLALAQRYTLTAATYLSPDFKPRSGSLMLDLLRHAYRLPVQDRTAFLLALVWQGSPLFTPDNARQVARFCPTP